VNIIKEIEHRGVCLELNPHMNVIVGNIGSDETILLEHLYDKSEDLYLKYIDSTLYEDQKCRDHEMCTRTRKIIDTYFHKEKDTNVYIRRIICNIVESLMGCSYNESSSLYDVVMIRYIETYLHPSLQISIINMLMNEFKDVQFIITTLSPHVIGELKKENIILLTDYGPLHPMCSYGMNIDYITKYLITSSTRNKEISKKINIVEDMIDENKLEQAKILLESLYDLIPEDVHLVGLSTRISRIEILSS